MSQDRGRIPPARTTIVGGQPPGNARAEVPIPVAVEELLGMAATTPTFAAAFFTDPRAAAAAAGLELTATEGAILAATDRRRLGQMVDEVRRQLPEPQRRAFLEQAALAVAVLVGGGAAVAGTGCADRKPPGASGGARQPARQPPPHGMHEHPPMEPPASAPAAGVPEMHREPPTMRHVVKGARPDRPRPTEPGVITGSRPRCPEKSPRPRPRENPLSDRARKRDQPPPTFGMRPPRGPTQ